MKCAIASSKSCDLNGLVAKLVITSLPGYGRAQPPGFEPRSDYKLFIGTFLYII